MLRSIRSVVLQSSRVVARPIRAVCSSRAVFHRSLATDSAAAYVKRQPATEAKFPTFASNGKTQHFINNQFVDSKSGKTFATYNPGNGSVLAQVAEAQTEDVDAAVRAAHNAFYNGPWNRQMSGRDRGACLYRLAELLEKDREQLAVIEALNNGKTLSQAMSVDAPACAVMMKYWAGWADKLTGQTIPIGHPFFCYTNHEPVGVVGLIVPWNLPLIAVAAKLGPSLAAGNTVVLKTAEQTPLSALRLASFIEQAGFPPGVINIINGDGRTTGVPLVAHPLIDKVSFTGSVEVGKQIAAECARMVKRVTLELGGKNPVVVCDDADLDVAVEAVHNGLFWNDGEACAAGSRIFVADSIYDEFVARSVVRAAKRVVGNPFHPASAQGAQVSERQMNKILKYIDGAQQQGAKLEGGGGRRVGTHGYYIAPCVFSNVNDDMTIWKEEVFGPVMTINKFNQKKDGLEDVIRRANNSPYGLAAGVFTKDIKKGTELSRRIRSGMVFWNCYHVVDVSAPFGGFKQSGYGREGGMYGLLPYLEVKMVAQQVA